MTTINDAYINALLADATYALDDTVGDEYPKADLIEKLEDRMTPALAEYIGNNSTVVTLIDSSDVFDSGFDATVWHDKDGKTYVSMTGTSPGTDFVADIDLTVTGVAGAQIVDMVNWLLKNTAAAGAVVKQIDALNVPGPGGILTLGFVPAPSTIGTGLLSGESNITVNGHSLGGHLATAFAWLFGGQWPVDYIYDFQKAA